MTFKAPHHWSKNAAYIAQTRYARPNERSVEQIIDRIVGAWAKEDPFYLDAAQIKQDMMGQLAAPNSPQWFNTGVSDKPQVHACFINEVKDDLESISDLWRKETRIFKQGSGSGTNFSFVREEGAPLSGGGTSSGPMSFLKVGNSNAGAIKSGGTTRRAALMRILNCDHPDIEKFIDWKGHEEEKVKYLVEGSNGKLDYDWRGEAYETVGGQNSNNSVMCTNDFMEAVSNQLDWGLLSVLDRSLKKVVPADGLMEQMAKAAWRSGDPGIMFYDNINKHNTAKNDGDIVSSNPCCFIGSTKVMTSYGDLTFSELVAIREMHQPLPKVYTQHGEVDINHVWVSGRAERLTRVEVIHDGLSDVYFCTPEHVWVVEGIRIQAQDLNGVETKYSTFNTHTFLVKEPIKVYDLEVDHPDHLFYLAGNNGYDPLVHNSEYLFLNNTACNLASINLAKLYEKYPITFYEALQDITKRWITVLDVSIDIAGYPTEEFEQKTKEYRTLGLGFTGLHEYLIAKGLLYDSVEGRREAAEVTRMMREAAITQSKELAAIKGPAPAYERNKEHMEREYGPGPMRNFQLLAIAPTGTISFIMDALTTGCEPLYSRKVVKDLSGGDRVEFEYPGDVETAGTLSPDAHLKMAAAIQQYVCGGISKTINMPNDTTWQDIQEVYEKAWSYGLKSVSIYRDGSKMSQPLNNTTQPAPEPGRRRRLPKKRLGYTKKLEVASNSLYLRTGEYDDGTLGELFIDLAKEGSTLGGLMSSFARAISIGLQYGVPLEEFIHSFKGTKFEPLGLVYDHESIKSCTSLLDLIVQDLEHEYVDPKSEPQEPEVDLSLGVCTNCQSLNLVRTGTCKTCKDCGETTGCA